MNVTLLPSSLGQNDGVAMQYLTSFLIGEALAVDAGSLGFVLHPDAQARVKHVLLSHSHMDHLASLPSFLDTIFGMQSEPVTVYASQEVLDCMRTDLFNDRVWPNFLALTVAGRPFLRVQTLRAGESIDVGDLRVTPIPVDHVVPTFGFVVEDARSAVVFSADTGPTETLWREANARSNLKAIFLEVSFPDKLQALAQVSKHHTPASFALEVSKVKQPAPFYAYHLKPRYVSEVLQELEALNLPNVHAAEPGVTYEF